MGQVLHGCATTTHAVRTAIQRSKAPLKELAARYGLNHKTVAKWRKRAFVNDAPMGPKTPHSTVLSSKEEAIIVAFRKHTLLPLDDCLYALRATIPHLTRSSLHRCLKRHAISRLPEIAGDKVAKKPFKRYPRWKQRFWCFGSRSLCCAGIGWAGCHSRPATDWFWVGSAAVSKCP